LILEHAGGETELVVAVGPSGPTLADAAGWLKVEAAFAAAGGGPAPGGGRRPARAPHARRRLRVRGASARRETPSPGPATGARTLRGPPRALCRPRRRRPTTRRRRRPQGVTGPPEDRCRCT